MARLKVLTFNMQFGQTWNAEDPDNAPVDVSRTAEELLLADADIVLLQEVERVETHKRQINPPPNFTALRSAMSGYDSFFVYPPQDERELPFGYGLAIFSKTPLFDTETVSLPAPELEFDFMGETVQPTDRILIGARTRIEGTVVQLYNTHLQSFFIINRSSDQFPGQRDAISHLLRESQLPTLLGGDLNSAPGESTVEQIEGLGYRTVQREQGTWLRMPYVLDHLFYSRHFELHAHQVIQTSAADHKILIGDLGLRNADAKDDSSEVAGVTGHEVFPN